MAEINDKIVDSAVNNRPQHEAPRNKIQCLWGLFPGASC